MLERQLKGIAKAKGEGKYKGRKPTARAKRGEVLKLRSEGVGPAEIAKRLCIAQQRLAGAGGGGGVRAMDREMPIKVELSADELLLLCNALNEVRHSLEIPEFSPRLGVDEGTAKRLHERLLAMLSEHS